MMPLLSPKNTHTHTDTHTHTHTTMLMSFFHFLLSPLADSFLVLMILAAYSWPVQSLTQRRTTEKAPLGNKDRRQEEEKGQLPYKALSASKRHLSYQIVLAVVLDAALLSSPPDLNA